MELKIDANNGRDLRRKIEELAESYLEQEEKVREESYKVGFEDGLCHGKTYRRAVPDDRPPPVGDIAEFVRQTIGDPPPPHEDVPDPAAPPTAPKKPRKPKVSQPPEPHPPSPLAAVVNGPTVALVPDPDEEDDEPAKSAIIVPGSPAFDALRELVAKTNMDKGREVLERFRCSRISDLPEKKAAEFIKACKEACGNGGSLT